MLVVVVERGDVAAAEPHTRVGLPAGGEAVDTLQVLDRGTIGRVVDEVLVHAASSDGRELQRIADEHHAPVHVVGQGGEVR